MLQGRSSNVIVAREMYLNPVCHTVTHALSVSDQLGLYVTLAHRPAFALFRVQCDDDEDVEWLWTETPDGRFVSGYRLVQRLNLPT